MSLLKFDSGVIIGFLLKFLRKNKEYLYIVMTRNLVKKAIKKLQRQVGYYGIQAMLISTKDCSIQIYPEYGYF